VPGVQKQNGHLRSTGKWHIRHTGEGLALQIYGWP
jgi:hypothetical protein